MYTQENGMLDLVQTSNNEIEQERLDYLSYSESDGDIRLVLIELREMQKKYGKLLRNKQLLNNTEKYALAFKIHESMFNLGSMLTQELLSNANDGSH